MGRSLPLALGIGVVFTLVGGRSRARLDGVGVGFLGLAVWVFAGLLGPKVSGLGLCRVAAFGLSGLHDSDFLFITISHCAWRRVISLSKATKKRSKENAFTALP
jgi:hypothetical protein